MFAQRLPLSSHHCRAEWVLPFDGTSLAGPLILRARPDSHRREVVVGHGGDRAGGPLRLTGDGPLPPSRLAQRTRAKALLKLLFINADGARDANHAVGWDLALSDSKVDGVSGDSEPIGNFAYFCKSRRHRHDLVFS